MPGPSLSLSTKRVIALVALIAAPLIVDAQAIQSPNYADFCLLAGDYDPVCIDPTHYKYCLKKSLIDFQVAMMCPLGTVCCPRLDNSCVAPSECPEVPLPPPPPPKVYPTTSSSGGNDPGTRWIPGGPPPSDLDDYCANTSAGIICIDGVQYANCDSYEMVGIMSCGTGTVCCVRRNQCDWAANCPNNAGVFNDNS